MIDLQNGEPAQARTCANYATLSNIFKAYAQRTFKLVSNMPPNGIQVTI